MNFFPLASIWSFKYPRGLSLSPRAVSLSILVPCSFRPFGVVSFSIVFLMPDTFALALGSAGPDDEDAPPVSSGVTKIGGAVSSGLTGLSIA